MNNPVWEVDNPWYRRSAFQVVAGRLVWTAGRFRNGRWEYRVCSQPAPTLAGLLSAAGVQQAEELAGLTLSICPKGCPLSSYLLAALVLRLEEDDELILDCPRWEEL